MVDDLVVLFFPALQMLFGLVFAVTVALLKFSRQLGSFSVNHIKIVISQLAPLLLYFALQLLPIAFENIFVQAVSPERSLIKVNV